MADNDSVWFLQSPQGGMIYGPYSMGQINEGLQTGKLTHRFWVSVNKSEWSMVGEILDEKLDDSLIEEVKQFGPYQVQDELGRGANGVVYKAVDSRMQRTAALKVLLHQDDWFGSDEDDVKKERFRQEIQLTANLDHPNIIKIYDAGFDPYFYFAMEYIEGRPLDSVLQDRALTFAQKLDIFYKICEGMEYAHKKKIIHRDLKPANVFLSKDGQPKILDFGLAKAKERDKKLSQDGSAIGTPQYMAPEQASAEQVTSRADVYSLGCILYEMLTGRPPFDGDSIINILTQLATEDPIVPSKLNTDIPKELELICLHCLEKKPDKRYISAAALRKDIRKYMDNRPISIKPPSTIEMTTKWIQRNKLVTGFVITLFTALFVAIYAIVNLQQTQEQLNYSNSQLEKKNVKITKQNIVLSYKNYEKISEKLALFKIDEVLEEIPEKKVFQFNGKNINYYWLEGICHYIQGTNGKAISSLSDALKYESSTTAKTQINMLLAMAHYNDGYKGEALKCLKLAINEYFTNQGEEWLGWQSCKKIWSDDQDLCFHLPTHNEQFEKLTSDVRAHGYSVYHLFPDTAYQKVSRYHYTKNADGDCLENQENKIKSDLGKLEYLLKEPEQWIQNMMDLEEKPRLSEVKDFIGYTQKAKIPWLLDMSTAFWLYLPHKKQGFYARNYQKFYSKQRFKRTSHWKVTLKGRKKPIFLMSLIPPGRFIFGNHQRGEQNPPNGPAEAKEVTKSFLICQTEVTKAQWKNITGKKFRSYHNKHPDSPLVGYAYLDIQRLFLHPNKIKFPDEIRWEYACQAGQTGDWLRFQEKYEQFVRCITTSRGSTTKYTTGLRGPINVMENGQIHKDNTKPNPWNLYNMYGNVQEICDGIYISDNSKRTISIKHAALRGGGHTKALDQSLSYIKMDRLNLTLDTLAGFRFIIELE